MTHGTRLPGGASGMQFAVPWLGCTQQRRLVREAELSAGDAVMFVVTSHVKGVLSAVAMWQVGGDTKW